MHWDITVFLFAILTFGSTLVGGLATLRFANRLHYFLAFSAGALVAVAFLDLLPSSASIALGAGMPSMRIYFIVVGAFVAYHALEKLILIHTHTQEEGGHVHMIGAMGVSAMIGHSLMDGVAIGTGFQTNFHLGVLISMAVVMHDFADGTNTMSILLQSNAKRKTALLFLFCDAAAPMVGAISTLFISIPAATLAYILAWFAGEFIYLGAADALPSAHALRSSKSTVLVTIGGVLLIAILTSVINL